MGAPLFCVKEESNHCAIVECVFCVFPRCFLKVGLDKGLERICGRV